eukprot:TRINITY_DN9766_c1_g2_i2.p1 TRINITY_DN9766_c1_g2~~TRINITY_DN9766_c1_g2_i2.p1  ORF type:complete len:341 (+),score=75.13 TRINITY_DN9766_c1_g2_i2:48-1025(+)
MPVSDSTHLYASHTSHGDKIIVKTRDDSEVTFENKSLITYTAEGDCLNITQITNEGERKEVHTTLRGVTSGMAEEFHTACKKDMRCSEKFVFIVNPKSGTGKSLETWATVEEYLKKYGINYEVHITQRPAHATEIAKEIPDDKTVTVCTIGGDGILHEVVNGLHQADLHPTIAIIPSGTGNGLAATLGITSLHCALYTLLKGAPIPYDLFKLTQPNPCDRSTGVQTTTEQTERVGFLHLTYGIIADIDFESEWLRMLGAARFPITAVNKIMWLSGYRAKVKMTLAPEGTNTTEIWSCDKATNPGEHVTETPERCLKSKMTSCPSS